MEALQIDTEPSTRVERWSHLLGIKDAHVTRASFWLAADADRIRVLEQRVILQDVARTRTDEVFFTGDTVQLLLREGLCSFCAYHHFEYMQGMNEVLAPLLAVNLVSSPGTYTAISKSLSAANSPATTPARAGAEKYEMEVRAHTRKNGSESAAGTRQGAVLEAEIGSAGTNEDDDDDDDFAGFDCEMIVPEGQAVVEAYERRCREADLALEVAAEHAGKANLTDDDLRKALLALATARKAQDAREDELKNEQTKQHAILQYNAAFVLFERIILSMCPAIFRPTGILALQGQLASFHLLLFYADAPLANYLSLHGMRCDVYAQSWLITLFARRTPVELALYVWEHLLQRDYCSNPHKLICLSVAFIVQQRNFLASITPDELPQCLVRLKFTKEDEVDSVFALAEHLFMTAPPAQLRDSRLVGFDSHTTEHREILLKDMMTRSCAMSHATDVASYLMDATAEDDAKGGALVKTAGVKRSTRPLTDNQYSRSNINANANTDVTKLPVATILVATPLPAHSPRSTAENSWNLFGNVVAGLDNAIAVADRALDDDTILDAVNSFGSKFSSLLGGSRSDSAPIQEKEKAPVSAVLNNLQALQRAPRYLLIDCRSPEELKKSKVMIEGALPVSPLNISDICRVAVLKQKAGHVPFAARPSLTMESTKLIFEFLLFCTNMGGMHFILFDSDEDNNNESETQAQIHAKASTNGVHETDDRSKRPTFHLATALLVLGFSRISIVHGPNVQSAGTEEERGKLNAADLQQERAEDEERVMLSLPISVQQHVRSSLTSSTDGFHALMVELLGRQGAVTKPLTNKYDTRGTTAAVNSVSASYLRPSSHLATGEASRKLQEFYISTKQSSLIVDKVNRVRKMLDAIEEKEAIAKIKSTSPKANSASANNDVKGSGQVAAIPQWGSFLGGTVSSLSSLSLESFPEMPTLRQLFDAGRAGNDADFAPKSALDTNSGSGNAVASHSNRSDDVDRYSSAAIKERRESEALEKQQQLQENQKQQGKEPEPELERKQKSPKNTQAPPAAGNTSNSSAATTSVNNSPSRFLNASDAANKIRLMKYVVLTQAKESPSMATNKQELSLILNGLRELKNNLSNIERLGIEFGQKLDERVGHSQQHKAAVPEHVDIL